MSDTTEDGFALFDAVTQVAVVWTMLFNIFMVMSQSHSVPISNHSKFTQAAKWYDVDLGDENQALASGSSLSARVSTYQTYSH